MLLFQGSLFGLLLTKLFFLSVSSHLESDPLSVDILELLLLLRNFSKLYSAEYFFRLLLPRECDAPEKFEFAFVYIQQLLLFPNSTQQY